MKTKRIASISAVTVATLLLFTGCSGNNQNDSTQNSTQNSVQAEYTQTPEQMDSGAVSGTTTPEITNNSENQTVASQYYLSLGTLEKGVVVEGENRDRDEVEIYNGKLIFPLGTIHSVAIRQDDGREKFVDASEKNICSLLNAVESAECSTDVTVNSDNTAEIILVYETWDNEYRTVYIESAGNNYYLIRVKEDDREEIAEMDNITDRRSGREYEVVQVQSREISGIMEKWIL